MPVLFALFLIVAGMFLTLSALFEWELGDPSWTAKAWESMLGSEEMRVLRIIGGAVMAVVGLLGLFGVSVL